MLLKLEDYFICIFQNTMRGINSRLLFCNIEEFGGLQQNFVQFILKQNFWGKEK